MTAFGEPGCRELATFASQVEMEPGAAGDGDFVGDFVGDQDISRSSRIRKNPHFPHWWVTMGEVSEFLKFQSGFNRKG